MSVVSGEQEDEENGGKKDGLGVPQLFIDTGNPTESQAEQTLAKGILPSIEEVGKYNLVHYLIINWAICFGMYKCLLIFFRVFEPLGFIGSFFCVKYCYRFPSLLKLPFLFCWKTICFIL